MANAEVRLGVNPSGRLSHPRAARLLRPADFSTLRRLGKRISLRYFQCEYRPTDAPTARLGMAVSRRVSKRAVVRNRIRRQIRESFRLTRPRLPCCDLLVIARTQAAEANNAALRAELDLLWTKLRAAHAAAAREADSAAAPLNATPTAGTMRGRA
jgi:ribonuclease P protein component